MRKALIVGFLALVAGFYISSYTVSYAVEGTLESRGPDLHAEKPEGYPVATLAGGCFWCLESEFRVLEGVLHTRVGYNGGALDNPGYRDITTGLTGHAESIEITYDPEKISYKDLVEFFLVTAHDPTQLNRQGVDVGTQYRSEIFYHNDEQREIAETLIQEINDKGVYSKPIVTQLNAVPKFWEAEGYHQQYYEKYEQNSGRVHPRVVYKKQQKALKEVGKTLDY